MRRLPTPLRQLAAACAAHVHLGPATLVLWLFVPERGVSVGPIAGVSVG